MAFPHGCGDHHFLYLKKLYRGEPVKPLFREDELALMRAGWLQRNDDGLIGLTREVADYFAAGRRPPDEAGRRHTGDDSRRIGRPMIVRRVRSSAAA